MKYWAAPQTNSTSRDLAAERKNIESLILALSSSDGMERHHARRALARIGAPAVESLIESLADPRGRVRWEAAETLSEISDERAAAALVVALEDFDSGVRWVAVGALIALGSSGLPPLFKALIHRSESGTLREGARHVMHALAGGGLEQILTPVLAALNGPAPIFEVPYRAHAALHALRGEPDHRRPTDEQSQ